VRQQNKAGRNSGLDGHEPECESCLE
jgi:hypothetical protein